MARDTMSAPVVTVGEETDINEIARLLTAHRIKRVALADAAKGSQLAQQWPTSPPAQPTAGVPPVTWQLALDN
jgi:hypothetical protein